MKIIDPSVELLHATENPELELELAARTCYKSEGLIKEGSAGRMIKKLIESGHHAMIEHAYASFKFVTDTGITHEIVRHRIASFAQESTRWCNYSEERFGRELSFIQPPGLNGEQKAKWEYACKMAEAMYFDMIDKGCKAQIARSVLPKCLKAEIIMTANLREWRHFIKLRAAKDAHPQIQVIAKQVCRILVGIAPNVYGDLYDEFIVQGE